jgi:hypothetical protein
VRAVELEELTTEYYGKTSVAGSGRQRENNGIGEVGTGEYNL